MAFMTAESADAPERSYDSFDGYDDRTVKKLHGDKRIDEIMKLLMIDEWILGCATRGPLQITRDTSLFLFPI